MECPTCDRVLNTEQGMRQHHTKVHGEPLPNRECKGCDSAFYDPKSRRSFCDDCNPNAGENNGNWKDAKESAECRICGKSFEYYPTDKEGVFCSDCVANADEFLGTTYAESVDAERVERECEQCGTEMVVLKSDRKRGRGRFCSETCLHIWMTLEEAPTYNRPWRSVRRRALERDDFSCQNCGTSKAELGQNPDVHHIEPVRTFDNHDEAHRLENVICLCKSCHISIEFGNIPLPD